jgi:hypothetical protein
MSELAGFASFLVLLALLVPRMVREQYRVSNHTNRLRRKEIDLTAPAPQPGSLTEEYTAKSNLTPCN